MPRASTAVWTFYMCKNDRPCAQNYGVSNGFRSKNHSYREREGGDVKIYSIALHLGMRRTGRT